MKKGIIMISRDITKFSDNFGADFSKAMLEAPWEEILAYENEILAYMAALTFASIAYQDEKTQDTLLDLIFAVISCVLAMISVAMAMAGGSVAKKLVFQVLDRLVFLLLNSTSAIVPALITYINDPTGGKDPFNNKQVLIDACIQSGIGIAMSNV